MCNLQSQVECLQYNNRIHMTQFFINFSKHSINFDGAHGTGLTILIQNSSQIVAYLWPPYVIGQAIIFVPCGFYLLSSSFFSSPNLRGSKLDVYYTSTHGVALVRI